jgi:glycogen(starch) synthase
MLTWDFPPRVTGGTAAHVTGLSKGLAAAGHDVVVLTLASRRADHAGEQMGPVRVLRADIDLPHIPDERYLAQAASANHDLTQLALDAESPLAGWVPDVVHGHDWRIGWSANTLARHYGVPFLLTMHGTERVRHGGNLPTGRPTDVNSIEWWLAFKADRLIASTRLMVDQLVTGFELAPEQVVRIPNGINPALWDGHDRHTEREQMIVSWGRVQYEKGFQVLARAMTTLRTRVPDVSCTIAGRGSYLPELQTQIDVEGVSDLIDLPGFLRDDELRSLVQRAGCVVIPSLYEPFGLVALEALAAGAPLIVARTGGLAELIAGTDAGLTFEPGNPDDLAHCVEMVLSDQALAQNLTRNARELIETKYAWDAIAASVVTVYETALTHRRG